MAYLCPVAAAAAREFLLSAHLDTYGAQDDDRTTRIPLRGISGTRQVGGCVVSHNVTDDVSLVCSRSLLPPFSPLLGVFFFSIFGHRHPKPLASLACFQAPSIRLRGT